MEQRKKGGGARYAFAVVLAITLGLAQIWIIQLARNGEAVGYIILTGEGILVTVLVVGLVIAFATKQAVISNASPPPRRELKDMYDTTRLLNQQNKTLRQLLEEQGLDNPQLPASRQFPLQPGQMMTADGMVIEGEAFDNLDEEE